MIIAKRKDLTEIGQMIAPYNRILILGCGTCTTVCTAGGPKECRELAESLVAGRVDLSVEQDMVPRQCAEKFVARLEGKVRDFDAVVSMACGNGVQAMAKRFPNKPVLPALNTLFIGIEKEPGVWTEMCRACGDCILWRTAGICPVTRCAKGLLNGPCGGSREGRCEVSKDLPCAWQEIYQGLKRLGLTDYLKSGVQIKGWAVHPGRLTKGDEKPKHNLTGAGV
jgi:ferredoxin